MLEVVRTKLKQNWKSQHNGIRLYTMKDSRGKKTQESNKITTFMKKSCLKCCLAKTKRNMILDWPRRREQSKLADSAHAVGPPQKHFGLWKIRVGRFAKKVVRWSMNFLKCSFWIGRTSGTGIKVPSHEESAKLAACDHPKSACMRASAETNLLASKCPHPEHSHSVTTLCERLLASKIVAASTDRFQVLHMRVFAWSENSCCERLCVMIPFVRILQCVKSPICSSNVQKVANVLGIWRLESTLLNDRDSSMPNCETSIRVSFDTDFHTQVCATAVRAGLTQERRCKAHAFGSRCTRWFFCVLKILASWERRIVDAHRVHRFSIFIDWCCLESSSLRFVISLSFVSHSLVDAQKIYNYAETLMLWLFALFIV